MEIRLAQSVAMRRIAGQQAIDLDDAALVPALQDRQGCQQACFEA